MLEKQIKRRTDEGVVIIPKKCKLNIRFHNPNTPETTADYILKICCKASQKKLERILQEEAAGHTQIGEKEESSNCFF